MSSLTESPTSPSLDALPDLEGSLLSESLSLDTISIASVDSIPPFPYGCMVPLSSFLSLNDASYSLENSHLPAITTTIPTPPRLRTLLKENLCISRWTESLVTAEAPGHIPWAETEVENRDALPWKSEGSLYPSDTFRNALFRSRQRVPLTTTIRQLSPSFNSHHRNALVFEREITLKSEGKTKRWSVQVPAGSMNPDLADMMMELRNINSYFKEEDEEKEKSAEQLCFPSETNVDLHPPSLIVSNSQYVIPLSLESTGSLHNTVPTTLAARRGNKAPAPLTVKLESLDPSTYPSIPTAFLGSPSSYQPTFEFAGETRSSAAFQDMIDSLMSQCASLKVNPLSCPALQGEEAIITLENIDRPLEGCDDVDEWGFANSLLEKFPDFCVDEPTFGQCHGNDRCIESRTISSETTLARLGPMDDSFHAAPSPSPSIASSVSPTLSSSSPRGILKRCKSVRFAEQPPGNLDLKLENIQPQEASPIFVRHSIGPPPARALKRPSPLRNTYSPQPNAASVPDPSPRQNLATRSPVIAPKPPTQPLKRAVTIKTQQKEESSVPSLMKHKSKTQDPPSLGRSFRNTLVIGGKENKKLKDAKTSFSSNRHTMDENALRRASTIAPPEAQKSRMPVPLRNIFTRFK